MSHRAWHWVSHSHGMVSAHPGEAAAGHKALEHEFQIKCRIRFYMKKRSFSEILLSKRPFVRFPGLPWAGRRNKNGRESQTPLPAQTRALPPALGQTKQKPGHAGSQHHALGLRLSPGAPGRPHTVPIPGGGSAPFPLAVAPSCLRASQGESPFSPCPGLQSFPSPFAPQLSSPPPAPPASAGRGALAFPDGGGAAAVRTRRAGPRGKVGGGAAEGGARLGTAPAPAGL